MSYFACAFLAMIASGIGIKRTAGAAVAVIGPATLVTLCSTGKLVIYQLEEGKRSCSTYLLVKSFIIHGPCEDDPNRLEKPKILESHVFILHQFVLIASRC